MKPVVALEANRREKHTIILGEHRLTTRPVARELDDKVTRTDRGCATLRRAIQGLMPEIDRTVEKATATFNKAQQSGTLALEALKEEKKRALPCERRTLNLLIGNITSKIAAQKKETETLTKTKRQPITIREQAIDKAAQRMDIERNYLDRVLAQYPTAQHLSLDCLTELTMKNGLPAVALFSPEHEKVSIKAAVWINGTSFGFSDESDEAELNELLPMGLSGKMKKLIVKATGIKNDNSLRGETTSSATSITISARFSDRHQTIPPEARTQIRAAITGKLFDQVVLLAEVKKWEVTYYELTNDANPLIKGKVLNTISRDPLIVGLKRLPTGRLFSMVIGAFDVTPIEQLIAREWCTKP
jgi:hypothetical protein